MKTHRYLELALAAVAVVVVLRVVGFSSGALPLLEVVACPLMMFFMMRDMGGMDHSNHTDRSDKSEWYRPRPHAPRLTFATGSRQTDGEPPVPLEQTRVSGNPD